MYVTINVSQKKEENMRNKNEFDFYNIRYGWHQDKLHVPQVEKNFSLTLDVKNRVISLLFGHVSDAVREELHEYMDAQFKKCHSLALFVTDKDRKKESDEKSKFALLCDKLGLDPGRKEVQVTDHIQILYSDDYAVPGQPR